MIDIPKKNTDSGRLVQWARIGDGIVITGNCLHLDQYGIIDPPQGLTIYYDEKEEAYYLFRCDSDWVSLSDTWHQTLEEALSQAEFEFQGITDAWTIA